MSRTVKTIHYLRARRENRPFDLQSLVKRARKMKPNCVDNEIELGGGDVVRIQHYRVASGGVRLHLTRYVPGEQAATLRPKVAAPEDDEGAQPPPENREFKDGDGFLLIQGHHVLYCAHGILPGKAALYLTQLFRATDLYGQADGFELVPASQLDKLRLIQDHGVKSIQLSASAFDASIPPARQRTGWVSKTFAMLRGELAGLNEQEELPGEQRTLEDLVVNLEIKLDGNMQAVQGAQDLIETLAESILDEDDLPVSGFSIVTQKNERITADQIRLQTSVRVTKQANSVSHNSVWEAMETYFEHLTQGNLLER